MFTANPYYETLEYFHEPFWKFKDKIDSLQRLVILVNENISGYLQGNTEQIILYDEDLVKSFSDIEPTLEDIEDDIGKDIFKEEHKTDQERFSKYFYGGVISTLIALFETLLDELVKDISKGKFNQPKDSYVKRYIDILKNDYGLPINITREESNRLYKIRKIRNDYIHSLGSEFAAIVSKGLEKIQEKQMTIPYNLDLVDFAFKTISDIVSKIEKGYIDNYHNI